MVYIDSLKGGFLVGVILVILVFVIPHVDKGDYIININLIISVSTFIFAILVGFYISRLSTRYDRIRELVGLEDANQIVFYKTSQIYGKEFSDEVREIIDRYYIVAYDHTVSSAYKETMPYIMQLWDRLIKLGKHRAEDTYSFLLQTLSNIENSRKIYSSVYEEKMHFGQWFILIVLCAIIIGGLFIISENSFASGLVTVLLSTVLIMVLLIIRDLNNFMLGGAPLMEESGQLVLEAIGKDRYYNKYFIDSGITKIDKSKNIKRYRLGLHKPGADKFEIQVVEL